MKQIPLSQGKFALVDDEDFEYLSQWKWQSRYEYATRGQMIDGNYKIIWMHRVINKTPEGFDTDHINRIKSDNRKINLRSVTRTENLYNSKKHKNCTSKYKGVCWRKREKIWCAYISINKKIIGLGNYKTEEEAAMAYNKYAIENFSDFVNLNMI